MSETVSSRTFEITQYETDPKTGKPLLAEKNISFALQFRTIGRWAYILHDKDVYSEEDEAEWNKQLAEAGESPNSWAHPVKAGHPKPAHWHIVVYCRKSMEPGKVAEWFSVPEELVKALKGNGAFWSSMEYLTHEHPKDMAQGKHRYPDEEVKSNVDWRGKLDARAKRKKHQNAYEMNAEERLQYDILYNGLTLAEAMQKDPEAYMKCSKKIRNLRQDYLAHLPRPKMRMNYYVEGPSGSGKSLLAHALARSFCPNLDDDSKIFFKAGAKGSAFDGYDGQRVIIWEDRRASDFLDELHGSVLNVFDTYPTWQSLYTRYGSTVLLNEVNIINGTQPYNEFLDALAEDRSQSYRRFPVIIRLRMEDFDILFNKGFVEDNRDFEDYIEYQHVRMDLQELASFLGRRGA